MLDAVSNDLVIDEHAESGYLKYAMAVVRDRALAAVQDGQKPVQLRILYTMRQLGLGPTAKPVKSARIVGDVLGKHHPHGDGAAYDAMVRMAQDFSLRYPLIIGQGNFGSRDGDTAAAMRYTEARLSPIAEGLLLSELGQGTVDFVPNYDGTLTEPAMLPARLPLLLLNGTMGIAVGMASNIPPHNLREVAAAAALVLEKPEATLDEVLEHIQGPDFPDGGHLISSRTDLVAAYTSGRGTLRCRARWVKEDLARNQWQIAIHELPYQVSTKTILEELDALTNPQPPAGKKTITQQQANLKQLALDYLEKAADESGKEHKVRIVLSPRNAKVDPDRMMAFLLANTSLEATVSVNMTLLGLNGNPRTKGLVTVLSEWGAYRVQTVRRRTAWQLDVVNRRIHILEGRMTVYLNLDAVIKIIREADDPKAELMSAFSLSEEQANDILEMRLRQLNKLEGIKIERELDELRKEAERLAELLADEVKLKALVVQEVREDAARFGDDRRTLVQPEARTTATSTFVPTVVDEDVTIVVSRNLWVKAYKGHRIAPESFAFKQGDGLLAAVETRTVRQVYLMDSRGRAYAFAAASVPTGRGDGAPLSTLIELQDNAKVHALLAGDDEMPYLFAGERGYGFVAPLKSLEASKRAGKVFLKLQDDEAAMAPVALPPGADGKPGYVVCGSSDGRMLAFTADEVKTLANGGMGVQLMVLGDGVKLSALFHVSTLPAGVQATFKDGVRSVAVSKDEWTKYVIHRARKGCQLPKKAVLAGEG